MYDEANSARRRELERRAYAPGGGLSDAEADELRELSRRPVVVSPAPEQDVRDPEPFPEPVPESVPESDVHDPESVPERAAEQHDEGPTPDTAPAKQRRRWVAPVAAVAALVLGFGGGWLAFGRDTAEAMTDAQREVWLELQASERYDPGTVELLGAQFGVDAWHALSQDGDNECLILTGPDREPSPTCVPQTMALENPYHLQASTSLEENGKQILVWASVTDDIRGEATVIMQRQYADEGWDWRAMYSEAELPIAEFLHSEGYDGNSLSLLGYDEETPVWLSQYDRTCLIVATAQEVVAQACGEAGVEQDLDLVMPDRSYRATVGGMRGPTLTIMRAQTSVVCDVDSGYCASADDKTGEIGG